MNVCPSLSRTDQCQSYEYLTNKVSKFLFGKQHSSLLSRSRATVQKMPLSVCALSLRYALVLSEGKLYLSNINPVTYDTVCGLRIFLCPLQVVGIVVSFLDSDRVRCVKVELSIVRLC